VLARIRYCPIDGGPSMSPATHVALGGERSPSLVAVPRLGLVAALARMGVVIHGLAEVLDAFAREPRAGMMPAIIAIDGEIFPAWVRVRLTEPGGDS
jgi:hypothetical protein